MALSAEYLIDRTRMRRKLTFWRVVTLLCVGAFVVALFSASGLSEYFSKRGNDHIARIKISGVITDDRPLLKLLEEVRENDRIKGVVLAISSPGGTTVGGEAIFEAVRKLALEKPVATSVGTLAASAGYMIACASDHIVARQSSIVGSIGVIFQYPDASQLLEKVGFAMKEIKSSPLKAEPSPFHPASEEAKEMINKVVRDSYAWFVDLVQERRNFTPAQIGQLADGSVFSGRQGVENGLIDAIGDEKNAKAWILEKADIKDDLDLITWKPDREGDGLLGANAMVLAVAKMLNIELSADNVRALGKQLPNRLFIDGLVSMGITSGAIER